MTWRKNHSLTPPRPKAIPRVWFKDIEPDIEWCKQLEVKLAPLQFDIEEQAPVFSIFLSPSGNFYGEAGGAGHFVHEDIARYANTSTPTMQGAGFIRMFRDILSDTISIEIKTAPTYHQMKALTKYCSLYPEMTPRIISWSPRDPGMTSLLKEFDTIADLQLYLETV